MKKVSPYYVESNETSGCADVVDNNRDNNGRY